jgi:hypothetical protein
MLMGDARAGLDGGADPGRAGGYAPGGMTADPPTLHDWRGGCDVRGRAMRAAFLEGRGDPEALAELAWGRLRNELPAPAPGPGAREGW